MPVESELEAEALNAWRQLVQVLTHEIMNSLTPVASLSHTAREPAGGTARRLPAAPPRTSAPRSTRSAAAPTAWSISSPATAACRCCRKRGQERVRWPPVRAPAALVGPAWQARGGDAVFTVEPASLELMVDPGQLEQALINLLKNAFEATAEVARRRAWSGGAAGRAARGCASTSRQRPRRAGHDEEKGLAWRTSSRRSSRPSSRAGCGIGLAMVRQKLVHAPNGGTVRYAHQRAPGAAPRARFVITRPSDTF
jgi:hypothetical protein